MKLTIKTLFGFENLLAKEIMSLGGEKIEKITRGVKCEGNSAFLYRANLSLRTAMKILVPIYTFHARDQKQLYDKMITFDWSNFLDVNQTFALESVIFSEIFTHSNYVNLKAKDAIINQYKNKYRRHPSIDTYKPDVLFNIHCANDFFTLSMDSSGVALNRRGYREEGYNNNSMNEVLAAGMLMLTEWDKKSPLVDLMCGNGTIIVEAAMQAMNMGPNLTRKDFGFRTWLEYSPVLFNNVKSEEQAKVRKPTMDLTGIDIDNDAIQMAKKSLHKISLRNGVQVKKMDFRTFKPIRGRGMIVTNPTYGEQIGKDISSLYKTMGDVFKKNFSGYDAWITHSNKDKDALTQLGLTQSKEIPLYNGKLECSFCKYEL